MQSRHNPIFHDCQATIHDALWVYRRSGARVIYVFLQFHSSDSAGYPRQEEEHALPLRYSMVFIIHGDGDYIYHDTQGNERRADEKALVEATLVAMLNPQAEVFIFHEKPRRAYVTLFSSP